MTRKGDGVVMRHSTLAESLAEVSRSGLERQVAALAGLRHAWANPCELEKTACCLVEAFRECGLEVESQNVTWQGRTYRNLASTRQGTCPEKPWLLLGAHYDAAWGSPGADDNASGVAAMLEAARIIGGLRQERTLQFVAFTLEEPQPEAGRFLIGSQAFAREAKRMHRRYEAVLILESVGYTSARPGSQQIPPLVNLAVPEKGDFLGVVANRRSRKLMKAFCRQTARHVAGLPVVSYSVPPLLGAFIPEARFSDHASFWDRGYPALMLTDTAMFRNPHYHAVSDRVETLDFNFLADVTRAVVAALYQWGERGSPL